MYLKRIKRRREDKCWFGRDQHRMTRSHVLLHDRTRAAREKAWEGKDPGGVTYWPTLGGRKTPPVPRALGGGKNDGQWEDEEETSAAWMDGWIVWETGARLIIVPLYSSFLICFC
jgi:hypothetical protein